MVADAMVLGFAMAWLHSCQLCRSYLSLGIMARVTYSLGEGKWYKRQNMFAQKLTHIVQSYIIVFRCLPDEEVIHI